jgi:hypothetical protein
MDSLILGEGASNLIIKRLHLDLNVFELPESGIDLILLLN